MTSPRTHPPTAGVDLYWLPLGGRPGDRGEGGGPLVRWSGRAYEAGCARHEHRQPCDLYHSALLVRLDGHVHALEMAPAWDVNGRGPGVVATGPVGARRLGRSVLFRYEVRCRVDATIPDVAGAVDSPRRVSSDRRAARTLLDLVPSFPTATWGRDELTTGEMWNSNSLVAWLLLGSGHDTGAIAPPPGGRAPGWSAGLAVASRSRAR
ncbi:hypothetical protein ASG49_04770 [Marmoricola sp. Leaf446]|uniref:hypothetical protein n=1 Tax=Marmoricola sp. Leaf446 TaxID=1736379 RepID=UPI0007000960|nr:hypothetical protein [Marmoricola sp. Leaf446]KQT94918.1 hypothetical protein ASG49_04770 [Marmoricola sp. Leaf446]